MGKIFVATLSFLVLGCGHSSSKEYYKAPQIPGQLVVNPSTNVRSIDQTVVLFVTNAVAEKNSILFLFKNKSDEDPLEFVTMTGPSVIANAEKKTSRIFDAEFAHQLWAMQDAPATAVDTFDKLLYRFSGGTALYFEGLTSSLCDGIEHTINSSIKPREGEKDVTSTFQFEAVFDGSNCYFRKFVSEVQVTSN